MQLSLFNQRRQERREGYGRSASQSLQGTTRSPTNQPCAPVFAVSSPICYRVIDALVYCDGDGSGWATAQR
jgi:hypothetical protein